MPKPSGPLVALLLAALLALPGCGSGDSDEGGSGGANNAAAKDDGGDEHGSYEAFDVCGLLEPADLEAALGGPWGEGEATHHVETGGDQCIWGNTDPPPVKQFSIAVMREGHLSEGFEKADVTVKSLYEDTKTYMKDAAELDLGDDAYISRSTIAVLDGDTTYEFSTVLGTSPEAIAGLKELAQQVVG